MSAVRKNVVRKENENISCGTCTGNYLKNCNEAHQCFESFDLHRAKYCEHFFMARDAYDVFTYGKNSELVYECHYVGNNMYKIFFCHGCKMKCSDIWYTWESSGSNNLF